MVVMLFSSCPKNDNRDHRNGLKLPRTEVGQDTLTVHEPCGCHSCVLAMGFLCSSVCVDMVHIAYDRSSNQCISTDRTLETAASNKSTNKKAVALGWADPTMCSLCVPPAMCHKACVYNHILLELGLCCLSHIFFFLSCLPLLYPLFANFVLFVQLLSLLFPVLREVKKGSSRI